MQQWIDYINIYITRELTEKMEQPERLSRLILRCSKSVGAYMAVGGLAGVLVNLGCSAFGNSETQRVVQEYPQAAPVAGAVVGGVCNILLRDKISRVYRSLSKPFYDLKWDIKFWWSARKDNYD
jgi:hypothetical protein